MATSPALIVCWLGLVLLSVASVQLGGSNPQDLALCTKMAQDWGYDEVNLNCGCPSERVQKGAFGACLMNEVDVIKVDPRNTSKIGKEKYTKIKGLSVHYCAAYVINRRGMGFVD